MMESTTESRERNNSVFSNSSKYTNSVRYRRQSSQNFLHESYNSSLDFPTYISWQTLSSSVKDQLRHGSIKINRSNCLEWASPIREENERQPLIDKLLPSRGTTPIKDAELGATEALRGGISWQVAAFLLVNCALGAGVLNYPAAYDKIGGVLIATLVQLFLMTILAGTMIILVYSSDLNQDNSYHDVLLSVCGKKAQQLSATSIMLTCYGVCITFLIIIGDQYDRLAVSYFGECTWYLDRRFTITATAVIFILPMCYFERLDFLRYAGTLGVFAMLYVVFINFYEYLKLKPKEVKIRTSPTSIFTFFAIIPVFTFAYQCHEIAVPVYGCMKSRNIKSFSKATVLALVLLFFLYCAAGTCGYYTFGVAVSPDIMQLYDAKDPVVAVGVFALIVKMVTTYPPMIVCGRGALDGLYAEYARLDPREFIYGEKKRRVIITTLWFSSSLAFAIFTPNIGVAIEFLGSLASANVFIFPSLCLIHVTNRENTIGPRLRRVLHIVAYLLISAGAFTFILVLVQIYHELSEGKAPTHEVLCK